MTHKKSLFVIPAQAGILSQGLFVLSVKIPAFAGMTVFFIFFLLASSFALTVDTPLSNPQQEAQAQALFKDIRCVVCKSESIADSPAEVARDMRRDIRERIAAGDSSEAIRSTLAERYGDVILMTPPLKRVTVLLWFGPLIIVGLALFMALRYFRHPERSVSEVEGSCAIDKDPSVRLRLTQDDKKTGSPRRYAPRDDEIVSGKMLDH